MSRYTRAGATLALAGFFANEQHRIDDSNQHTGDAHPQSAIECSMCRVHVKQAMRRYLACELIKTNVIRDARWMPRVALP